MKSRAFIATLVAAAGSAHAQWSDNFNRPDGLIGGDWTTVSGTWAIQSNRGAHTSPAVNTILSHNLASGPYQQSTSQIDVFRPTGTTADSFVALMIGLGGADAIQVKVQSQGSSPNFNFLGIYHGSGANWGPWTGGLPFQALSAPFSSARLTVPQSGHAPTPHRHQLRRDSRTGLQRHQRVVHLRWLRHQLWNRRLGRERRQFRQLVRERTGCCPRSCLLYTSPSPRDS